MAKQFQGHQICLRERCYQVVHQVIVTIVQNDFLNVLAQTDEADVYIRLLYALRHTICINTQFANEGREAGVDLHRIQKAPAYVCSSDFLRSYVPRCYDPGAAKTDGSVKSTFCNSAPTLAH